MPKTVIKPGSAAATAREREQTRRSVRTSGRAAVGGPAEDLLSLEALAEAAECLRTLAHPHRLRMVQMLLRSRHTVGDLARACDIHSHMASEHLRLMKDRGLLSSRKDGREVYYRIEEKGLASIMKCVQKRFGVVDGRADA